MGAASLKTSASTRRSQKQFAALSPSDPSAIYFTRLYPDCAWKEGIGNAGPAGEGQEKTERVLFSERAPHTPSEETRQRAKNKADGC